jgi:hypothetical protein
MIRFREQEDGPSKARREYFTEAAREPFEIRPRRQRKLVGMPFPVKKPDSIAYAFECGSDEFRRSVCETGNA